MKSAVCRAIFLCAPLLFAQCSSSPSMDDPDTVVARVNQSALTEDELETELEAASFSSATLQMRKDWVADWIRTELLYQEALRRDLDSDAKTVLELERMRKDHLANVVLEHAVGDSLQMATDEEIAEYYDTHRQDFIYHEPELRLSVIVLADEATARWARGQLTGGRSTFEELARTRSLHPSSTDGGDLGFLKRADISDVSVQQIVFSMRVGQISRPVLSESGSFIFRVADRRETGDLSPLNEVRSEIVNRMLQDRRRDQVRRFVEALRQEAEVEINNPILMRSEPVVP